MSKGRGRDRFKITTRVSEIPMTQEQWEASEELLARIIARAIMADYAEQSVEKATDKDDKQQERD